MSIKLTSIVFKENRALIKVQVEGCLTPEERVVLKQLLYNRYPKIKEHSCKNSHGPRFDDCVETTSIPHILEHIILEELKETASPCRLDPSTPLRSAQDDVTLFVAKTSNLGGGVAKIELKYYDDISTLQAIKRAASSLNEMLETCKM